MKDPSAILLVVISNVSVNELGFYVLLSFFKSTYWEAYIWVTPSFFHIKVANYPITKWRMITCQRLGNMEALTLQTMIRLNSKKELIISYDGILEQYSW